MPPSALNSYLRIARRLFTASLTCGLLAFLAAPSSGAPPNPGALRPVSPGARSATPKPAGNPTTPTARPAAPLQDKTTPPPRHRPSPPRDDKSAPPRDGKPAPPRDTWSLDTLAVQAALDRAGYSPGVIDGRPGRKTTTGLVEFQKAKGLPVTGRVDPETRAALRVDAVPYVMRYEITTADRRDVGEVPADWNRKAKLDRLRYESLTALLAERGHCSRAALQRLNPGRKLEELVAGDTVELPNVEGAAPPAGIASLDVNLDEKIIRARNAAGDCVALFHCSIAKLPEKRPRGTAKITAVAFDPVYRFDPKMWPEVRSVKKVLIIPAGPRNPVGVCWIDLSRPGYGIHGTPNPELIGKTGSHGCIRLTNWDARRLGKAVRAGMAVKFVERGG